MARGDERVTADVIDEQAVRGGRRVSLVLHAGRERVPALWTLPLEPRPAPGALLLHGYTSRKEQVADSVGRALLAEGVASLAIDLPLHGGRAETGGAGLGRNPLELVRQWRVALADCSAGLRWLGAREEVDAERLAIVGYSLGSYLAVTVAARDPSVRAVVVAAGGDLPANMPYGAIVRTAVDPIASVRRIAGRPLLVVHGRRDTTVRPDQAERLFAAAGEPKTMRWWDAGHWLPDAAIADAAGWLATALRESASTA